MPQFDNFPFKIISPVVSNDFRISTNIVAGISFLFKASCVNGLLPKQHVLWNGHCKTQIGTY